MKYRTLFMTERGARHQADALAAAPPQLDVVMLRHPDRATLWPLLAEAVFIISERTGIIDAEMIAAAPQLRLIVRLGSLSYDIDTDTAAAQGVAVVTWPVRGSVMVAEHTIMQMLALAKRLREVESLALAAGDWGASHRTDEDTFAYNWTRRQGIGGLWRRIVGILGFGEIGAELARRLRGWDCTVFYNRRHRLPIEVERELGLTYAAQGDLLAAADFVVNLLPYFPSTEHALAAPQFAAMKPGACLVSCGSGSVIDETALAAAFSSGHLGGVALDTYEWEPLTPDNPLRQLAAADPSVNVLLTPHTAAGAPPHGVIPSRAEDYTPILRFLGTRD